MFRELESFEPLTGTSPIQVSCGFIEEEVTSDPMGELSKDLNAQNIIRKKKQRVTRMTLIRHRGTCMLEVPLRKQGEHPMF